MERRNWRFSKHVRMEERSNHFDPVSGQLKWGFSGKHRKDIADGISVPDVQWILQYLGRISDGQIQRGLAASGATPSEMDCYTRTLRKRIERLQRAINE